MLNLFIFNCKTIKNCKIKELDFFKFSITEILYDYLSIIVNVISKLNFAIFFLEKSFRKKNPFDGNSVIKLCC